MRRLLVIVLIGSSLLLPGSVRADPSSRTAQQNAVEQFYVELQGQAYRQAYAFLSPRFQSANPFAAWVAGYANTLSFEWRTYPTDIPSAVRVDLISSDLTASGTTTRYFTGVWNVVRGPAPGGWVLDSASITPSGPGIWPGVGLDFGVFSDTWYHHGWSMRLQPDGTAIVSFRVYTWCADDPTPPCDDMVGNNIIAGGHATITFTDIEGDTAYGSYDDGGWISLTLGPYDTAEFVDSDGAVITLCGSQFGSLAPDTPPYIGYCGA